MKIFKKVVSLILTLVFLMLNVYAQDVTLTTDTIKTTSVYDIEENVKAANLLHAIGVIDCNGDYESKVITRGEAAVWFAKFMNYNINGWSGNLEFFDVPRDSKYYAAIGVCRDLKIMSGYSDWQFGTDDCISVTQAVTSMIRVLGYDIYAVNGGGYPVGYLNQASQINLLDEIDDSLLDKPLTTNIFVQLMYNALDVEVVVNDGFTTDGTQYLKKDKSYICAVLGYEKLEGVIESVDAMSILDSDSIGKNKVQISSLIYDIDDASLARKYLGCKVDYIFEDTGKSFVDGKIVYLDLNSDVKTLEFDKNDIITSANGSISYDDGDRIKKISISSDVKYVYNNRPTFFFGFDKLKNDFDGKITFISNDNNGSYDVVKVDEFKNVVVYGFDLTNGVIYDKYNFDQSLHFNVADIDDTVFFMDAEKNSFDLNDLEDDMVISYMRSNDGEFLSAYVSNKKGIGVVSEIKKVNNKVVEIDLGQEAYKVHPLLSTYFDDIKIGKTTVTVTFDINGKIANMVIDDDEDLGFAFLTKARIQSGLSNNLSLRAFVYGSEKSQFETLKCRNKIRIDDVLYNLENEDDIIDAEAYLKAVIDGPIRIKKDLNGDISEIYTPKGDGLIYLGTSAIKYTSHIAPKIVITGDTVVIKVPGDRDEEEFGALKITSLTYDSAYSGELYKTSSDKIPADLFVMKVSELGGSVPGNDNPTMVVSDISTCIDDEGKEAMKITGYNGKSLVSYTRELGKVPAFSGASVDLQIGDIIRYGFNGGKMTAIQVMASSSLNKIYYSTNPSNSGPYAKPRAFSGYVYKEDGKFALFSYKHPSELVIPNGETEPSISDMEVRALTDAGADIYIYDRSLDEEKRVSVASVDDLYSYLQVGDMCSRVLCVTRGTILEVCVIVK